MAAFERVGMIVGVIALAAGLSAAAGVDSGSPPLVAICTFEAPSLKTDSAGFTSVTVQGCAQWVRPGEPVLPFRTLRLALPAGFTAVGVTAHATVPAVNLPGAWHLEIGRAPQALKDNAVPSSVSDVQATSAPIPHALAELASVQRMAGYAVAVVRVFPLQYTPEQQRLDFTAALSVEVALSPDSDRVMVPSVRPDEQRRVAAAVDNSALLSAGLSFLSTESEEPPVHYLLVTRASLLPAFQPLIDQKSAAGLMVHTETLEAIVGSFAGVDDAERLRNFIRHAYLAWGVQYVLLGGDIKAVPYRGVYARCSGETQTAMPSDLYFACLDGSWNHDGDALWGEPDDGEDGGDVDLVAEVYVGRAPVETAAEVTNFVAKCLSAEQTPFKACLAGEYLNGAGSQGGDALDTLWPRFDSSHCPVSWLDDRPQVSAMWGAADAVAALNRAPLLVAHFGHTDESTVMRLTRSQLNQLVNSTPFLLYSTGCDAGAFDNGPWSDCIAEEFVKRNGPGAFAVLANSREGWFDDAVEERFSGEFQQRFFERLLANEATAVGAAHQLAKEDLLGSVETSGSNMPYRWCLFGITLFGDPHQIIRVPLSMRFDMTSSGRVVTWNSWAGRAYSVYRATTLGVDPGICISSNIPATPPSNVYTDSVQNIDQAFYRVQSP